MLTRLGYEGSVSVVIANYNHGCYLGDALERLFAQSVAPAQVIVVDDGSTDRSVSVAERVMARQPRMRLLLNEENLGMIASFRRALLSADGEYLFWQGADDYCLPGLFEDTLSVMAEHGTAGLVFWDPSTVDESSGLINDNPMCLSDRPRYFAPSEFMKLIRTGRLPCLGGANAIYRRSAYDGAGGLFEECDFFVDGFASLSVALRYGACYVPKILTRARILPTSYMLRGKRRDFMTPMRAALRRWRTEAFADICPMIRHSGFAGWLMGNFGLRSLCGLMGEAELRYFVTPLAIRRMLWYWAKIAVAAQTPAAIKPTYQWLRNAYRLSVRRYGRDEAVSP